MLTSYATMQSNMFVAIGSTFAVSHPALSKWNPESSMASLMCTFGISSIFVCCERCNAASHAPRSSSVIGKMAFSAWHLESMRRVGASFIAKMRRIYLSVDLLVMYIRCHSH